MSSLVNKVTSDDTTPMPMYVLKELADLTQTSLKDCDTVRTAVLNRLGKTSPDVKCKALRTIKYLCTHGRLEFKLSFQRDNSMVKGLLSFQCPPDDLRGDKPAENVRIEAQECLTAIFSDATASNQQHVKVESFGNQPIQYTQTNVNRMGTGGHITSSNQGSYGGYGSTPIKQHDDSDSITGFNIRRTISSAILGGDGKPINAVQPNRPYIPTTATQSKYGGLSSNQYQSSSYSHYTHDPNHPQHSSSQQSSQSSQQSSSNNNNNGFSQNGLYGGGGSASSYQAAQQHGYNTYNQHQQSSQSSSQQQQPGGLGKSGPWGNKSPSSSSNNNTNSYSQYSQQPSQHQQQSSTQGLSPEVYTSRSGPSTRGSVEELGFEKRIVTQYTTNTPLKPNLTDVELKKFTQDSSSCAIDDILMILHDVYSNNNTPAVTINKALQLYHYIIAACGMISQECDKEHIISIQSFYENTTNKHIKQQSEKILAYFGLIELNDEHNNGNNNNGGITGFVAPPQSQQQQSQQQQQQSSSSGQVDIFNQETSSQNDLNSSFGFLNIDESQQQQSQQPQQPQSQQKNKMFGGLQVKKQQPQQQSSQQQQGSSFDFIDSNPSQQSQSTTQQSTTTTPSTNDIFALLGNDTTPAKKSGGLDLDALYSNIPSTQQQQQQQQQSASSAFDFLAATSNNNKDDIFGDLLTTKPQQPTPQPIQQPKPQATNSFDFVDDFM